MTKPGTDDGLAAIKQQLECIEFMPPDRRKEIGRLLQKTIDEWAATCLKRGMRMVA